MAKNLLKLIAVCSCVNVFLSIALLYYYQQHYTTELVLQVFLLYEEMQNTNSIQVKFLDKQFQIAFHVEPVHSCDSDIFLPIFVISQVKEFSLREVTVLNFWYFSSPES